MDNPSLQPYWYQHHRYHLPISKDPPKIHIGQPPTTITATLTTRTTHYQTQPFLLGLSSSLRPVPTFLAWYLLLNPESRPDYHDSPNRQALPSISEAIQGTEPGPYTFRPPSSIQTGSSLSPPFALACRSLPKTEKHPYLQQLLPASSFPPRQHALPTVSDSPRPPFTSLLSLPPVSDRRQSPSAKGGIPPQHHHPEQQKTPDPHHPLSGVYAHPPPPSPPPAPVTYQRRQLRPGRMPLPSYPTPPRYDYATPARYDATINRHLGSWSYQDSLSRISSSSRTILHCAESYSRIAREQHGAHLIPERLPTEWEVSDMLSNMELIKRSLEHVRDLVQTSIQNERTREGDKMNCFYKGEHHALIYGHAMQPSFGMTEIKKRRARAARPGRCHGCNRTNTPEWRRGPGGARTLCNACGLHYAKLERKRQLEASSIGPNSEEEHVV
ncbi:hypothetical protein FOXG_14899 [Fusarium oxysporum f. sp. lycopersici 4287]|uniref:GATA-type domain-containing protein n=1 Tax=Fusarium oxysporum f. sp. lycopersici (strain 4287 / CBS 123668 / FGSC 9935 / NRRL 34936) TaxID=426428 RepID=A0A0J9WTZ2_FUSO4|nr:hypothetical protein FOXG_14899 [Fusarium oxysporum f. sp. lycopersici 4287]KNB16877.1 hypothetical protein FOXG_14899 [Fusarium oxysporum f. sp. lycopersici 4287]